MANTYHSKLNKRYAAKLRVLEEQLPYFCTQYFNSKSLIFEKQTAFAYATDLRIFFTFLRDYLPQLADKDIKDIPVSILDELTEDDLKAYTTFLDDNRENGENGIQRSLRRRSSSTAFASSVSLSASEPEARLRGLA